MIGSSFRPVVTGIVAIVAIVPLAGCGGGDGVTISRAAFSQRLIERDRLSVDEARCVTEYVYAENPPEAIERFYDDRLASVSMVYWNSYGHSVAACSFADDLGLDLDDRGGGG